MVTLVNWLGEYISTQLPTCIPDVGREHDKVKNKNFKNYNSNKNNNNYIVANQMSLSVKMYHYLLFAVKTLKI